MSLQPLLSNHPYLHNLMRNDPRANTELNALISRIKSPGASEAKEQELRDTIKALEIRAAELEARAVKAETVRSKGTRFIKILGELMETQLRLSPYAQDVSEKKHYEIRFSADQVRLAVRWYWDVVADSMETTLGSGVRDPADDSEEA